MASSELTQLQVRHSLRLPIRMVWIVSSRRLPTMSNESIIVPQAARRALPRRINAGKLTGQKPALKMKEVWAIRIRLQLARKTRELALFNLAIDSKLRGCDLVRLRVEDVAAAGEVKSRAIIIQKKTGRPVQFEITEQTRAAVATLIQRHGLAGADFLFPSRLAASPRLSTRQYARLVQGWVKSIGLNPATYGTHSLRRTKAALIYRKTGNLRAVQLLLGHTKLESTVRYLGVEVDDALAISEQVDL
jgi:integrase